MDFNIDLNKLICDTFVEIMDEIINCSVARAVLNGGRSSTKSQDVATGIVVGCTVFKESAIALLRYQNKAEERLVNTFKESISYLGLEKYWKLRKSPLEYVLLDDFGRETDVSIKFTGCDSPENLKSFKPRRGAFRYIWFEELNNFKSMKEVKSLIQTFARGKGKHCVIMTYNPPMQTSSWVNTEFTNNSKNIVRTFDNRVYKEFEFEIAGIKKIQTQVIHKSTYLDVIHGSTILNRETGKKELVSHADWLGDDFIGDAEQDKVENEKYYRWAYLGEVVGTEANIFNNIKEWDGDTTGISLETIKRGFDWGYGGPDPCAYVQWAYDRRNRKIYALEAFGRPKMSEEEIAIEISKLNKFNFPVTADSGVPRLNELLAAKGTNIEPAKKGPDSRLAGVKWLQGLTGIYICRARTPVVFKQFVSYEYEVNKNDDVTSKIPDGNDHWIDATRYAFEDEMTV